MFLLPFFKLMAERNASDLFVTANAPIQIKIEGILHPVNKQLLSGEQIDRLTAELMNDEQKRVFATEWEMNLGIPVPDVGNFRVNLFRQRGQTAIVVRYIRPVSPSIEDLRLPPALAPLIMEKRGLIFVVGSTGSGKSSTVTAMMEHRNASTTGHLLTIEDPVEYIYPHRRCIVSQREVGIDTHGFSQALKNAMREAPDVLMIGEIRDRETMQHALNYAQAGHLCISTLHANNSYHMLNRVINFFPHEARESLLADLGAALKAVISQRLIRNVQGKLIPAVELLVNSSRIADLIRDGKMDEIKDAMSQSLSSGSQTFEQSLYKLFRSGEITYDEAMKNADSATNLAWLVNNAQSLEEQEADKASRRAEPKPLGSNGETDFNFDLNVV